MAGQVNRGSFFGEQVYKLASNRKFKNYVEIGTWNGEGSTKCFMDAIFQRLDDSCLYSIEANKEFYDQATKFWESKISTIKIPFNKLNLIYGRIIEVEDLTPEEEIKNHKIFKDHPWLTWRNRNIKEYNMCENVIDKLPSTIDVLFLDGGQFSTPAEWKKLKDRTNVVMLDDTNTYKTEKIRQEIVNDPDNWEIIFDKESDRHGIFMAARHEVKKILNLE